jgi:hypothetical protein
LTGRENREIILLKSISKESNFLYVPNDWGLFWLDLAMKTQEICGEKAVPTGVVFFSPLTE